MIAEETQDVSSTGQTSTVSPNEINELDHGAHKLIHQPPMRVIYLYSTIDPELIRRRIEIAPARRDKADVDSLDENSILKETTVECHARIRDIPVELSVQKIVFGKTSFTSYSTHTIELR